MVIVVYLKYMWPPSVFKLSNPFAPPLTSNPGSALGAKVQSWRVGTKRDVDSAVNPLHFTFDLYSFKYGIIRFLTSDEAIVVDILSIITRIPLQWRHNEHDGISNHRLIDCLLNRLFRCKSKKTTKLRVTGLCEGNPPVTDRFPSQRASNDENVFIWWRHHRAISNHNRI